MAQQVARALHDADPLAAHLRDELGHSDIKMLARSHALIEESGAHCRRVDALRADGARRRCAHRAGQRPL